MRMATVLTALALAAAAPVCVADEKKADAPAVKEIDLKGLKRPFPQGDAKKPTEIKSAEDLEQAFPEKDVREAIAAEVDFKTQKLLFFAWSGSGQDRLTAGDLDQDKNPPVVEFRYTAGMTRDLRSHFRLFALPKDAEWRFGGQ